MIKVNNLDTKVMEKSLEQKHQKSINEIRKSAKVTYEMYAWGG